MPSPNPDPPVTAPAAEFARELVAACNVALAHVEELRDAWMRGAIDERDGLGGTRSNRNCAVETVLRKAIDLAARHGVELEEKP